MPTARTGILRMLDANLNRATEGLRVAEDVLRFGYDHRALSGETRKLRHDVGKAMLRVAPRRALLAARDSRQDVGASRWKPGRSRRDAGDLLAANVRRAGESLRVLEEGARVVATPACCRSLQALRYRLYDLERRIVRTARGR